MGLFHRHQGRRLRRRRGGLAVPLPRARRRGDRFPAARPSRGGDVMRSPAARAKRFAKASGHAGVLVFFVTFLACPFYWMLMTTFKPTIDLHAVTKNPFRFNEPPTLAHLRGLFRQTPYLQWLS